MSKEPIKQFSVDKIDSLETYTWHLGMLRGSILTLIGLQNKAQSIGIFDKDETELSKTITHAANKQLTCIDDMLTKIFGRTGEEWDTLLPRLIEYNLKPEKPKGKKK